MIFLMLLLATTSFGQLGVKAGLNFANISNANEINASTRTGFHAGVFLAGSSKSILSSRTELLYSRQGYDFSSGANTGHVNLEYLMLPQLFAINITPLLQVQAGGQVSYLLNAAVDSTGATGNPTAGKVIDIYNRLDFGLGGGVEVHPIKMLIVGARINFSLGNLFKEIEPGETFTFRPSINAKNNLIQLYAGLKFGGK